MHYVLVLQAVHRAVLEVVALWRVGEVAPHRVNESSVPALCWVEEQQLA
jgi:hypothetical protein